MMAVKQKSEEEVKETPQAEEKTAPKLKVEEVEESTKESTEEPKPEQDTKQTKETPETTTTTEEQKTEEKPVESEKSSDVAVEEVKETKEVETGPEVEVEEIKEEPKPEEGKEKTEESTSEDKKSKNKRTLLIVLFVAAFVSLLVGGVLRFRSTVPQETKEPASTATPAPDATPEATAEPEVSLEDYDVQVQNGSGVAGRAGDVAEALEDAGFDGVGTANASSYDYTDTEVNLKADTPDSVFDAIKEALEGDYEVVKGDELDEDDDYDVIVVVGEKS